MESFLGELGRNVTRREWIFGAIVASLPGGCRTWDEVEEPLTVAVAANAVKPLEELAQAFEEKTGRKVRVVSGSSGKLYAQILAGAPFDLFFSADQKLPMLLEQAGLAAPGSRRTYAIGTLVLWSAKQGYLDGRGEILRQGGFRHLAIANPETAPYGAAARQVLENLGLWETLRPKLVTAESIGQAYSFIASGNAELGFVALSQLKESRAGGSLWTPPKSLYEPIDQQVVVLKRAIRLEAAKEFRDFTTGRRGSGVWKRFGYGSAEEAIGDLGGYEETAEGIRYPLDGGLSRVI